MASNKLIIFVKSYNGYFVPKNCFPYDKFKEAIDYNLINGDIFVAKYPKSGTTWTQYIVWQILNDAKEPPLVNDMMLRV
jgi:hypothetical protein